MVRIMTDNAANLPPELREQYNIREICLTYTELRKEHQTENHCPDQCQRSEETEILQQSG